MNASEFTPISYRTVLEPVHAQIVEKRSRFLTTLLPVDEEHKIHQAMVEIKANHPEANHHCTAFRLKDGLERASDDGEPSGTAGRPMLHVLQQQNLTDVLVIVTRYFGGTLLGAGGLVRAYTSSVTLALKEATIVSYIAHAQYAFTVAYSDYDRAQHLLTKDTWILSAEFLADVHLSLTVPSYDKATVEEIISALTKSTEAATSVSTCLLPDKRG